MIVYNSPGLTSTAASIRDEGGATRLLLNHSHEAMYGEPKLDVPGFVDERDRREAASSMAVAGVFTGRQLDDELEVIPTPGHAAGTTSYLWDNCTHRFMFTGDFVWIDNGGVESRRARCRPPCRLPRQPRTRPRARLRRPRPLGDHGRGPCFALADRAEIHTRIDAVIARVEAGEDR